MLRTGSSAIPFTLNDLDGDAVEFEANGPPTALVFFRADCPTCELAFSYLNNFYDRIAPRGGRIIGIAQDNRKATRSLIDATGCKFPILFDQGLKVSRDYDPDAVPAFFYVDRKFEVLRAQSSFNKAGINAIAKEMMLALGMSFELIAPDFDGHPNFKAGSMPRHRESDTLVEATPHEILAEDKKRAESRREASPAIATPAGNGAKSGSQTGAGPSALEPYLAAAGVPSGEIVATMGAQRLEITVESIAKAALKGKALPSAMQLLIPAMRSLGSSEFDLEAATAPEKMPAPLIVINGPIRSKLMLSSSLNVAFPAAESNLSVVRSARLAMGDWGRRKPLLCLVENEECNPWESLHASRGIEPNRSALTLFTVNPPIEIESAEATDAEGLLQSLATVLTVLRSPRSAQVGEALVVLCPAHARAIKDAGFDRNGVRDFLFENSGVRGNMLSAGEISMIEASGAPQRLAPNGAAVYAKFASPEGIHVVVAGTESDRSSVILGCWGAASQSLPATTRAFDESSVLV